MRGAQSIAPVGDARAGSKHLLGQRSARRQLLRNGCLAVVTILALLALAGPAAAAPELPAGGDEWLRAQLIKPNDLPGFGVSGDYPMSTEDVIPGGGSFFATIRDNSVRSAHRRVFGAFDGHAEVAIRLVELVNHAFAGGFVVGYPRRYQQLSINPPLSIPGGVVVHGPPDGGRPSLASAFQRGRVQAEVLVTSADSQDARAALLRTVSEALYRRMPDSADLTDRTSISLRRQQVVLAAMVVLTIIGVQLAGGLYGLVVSRSVRDRFHTWLRPASARPHPQLRQVDVAAAARRQRRRHTAGVLLRNAGFIGLILATFELKALVQLGVLAAAALAFSVVEILVARRRKRLSFRAAYGAKALVASIGTTAVTLVLWCVAVELIFVPMASVQATPAGYRAEQIRQFVLLTVAAGFLVLGLTDVTYRFGRRLSLRGAQEIIDRDSRPEILLLRSFIDERLRLRAHRTGRQALAERLTLRRFAGFEELLAWSLWRFGPAMTLGQPGTRLPLIGAARVFVPDRDWRAVVDEKIRSSLLVVANVGRTSALMYEIGRIRQAGALTKTLFVFPPVSITELSRRLEVARAALGLGPGVLEPVYPGNQHLLALWFDADGNPVVAVGPRRDDFNYHEAVEAGATALMGTRLLWVGDPAPAVRAVVPASAPAPIISLTPAQLRTRKRRRWFVAGPWVAWALTSCVAGLFAVPKPTLPAPLPGEQVYAGRVTALAAAGDGVVEGVDSDSRTLLRFDAGGHRTVHRFEADPLLIFPGAGHTYVTTRKPFGVVALRRAAAGDYTLAWTASLPNGVAGLAEVGDRIAVTTPATGSVLLLDAADGKVLKSTGVLARGPWSVVGYGGRFLVADLTDGALVDADPAALDKADAVAVPGPSALLRAGDRLVLMSIEDGSVVQMDLRTRATLGRTPIVKIDLIAAATPSGVVVGTYGRDPRLLFLSSTGEVSRSVRLPTATLGLAMLGPDLLCALPDSHSVIRLPAD